MDPTRLMNMTATVKPRTGGNVDVFGDTPLEDGAPVTLKCWLSQTQRGERTANEDIGYETWALYLEPAAADIVDFSSAVDVDGVVYEFDGPPWRAVNPRTGALTHVEATVRHVA